MRDAYSLILPVPGCGLTLAVTDRQPTQQDTDTKQGQHRQAMPPSVTGLRVFFKLHPARTASHSWPWNQVLMGISEIGHLFFTQGFVIGSPALLVAQFVPCRVHARGKNRVVLASLPIGVQPMLQKSVMDLDLFRTSFGGHAKGAICICIGMEQHLARIEPGRFTNPALWLAQLS
ncbi:hypothetical protein [Thermomonas sp.]|uniref:hypothetical protein n=1 Tax=Thermomonas sp. TaxID=1971895 RepID=UPI00248A35EA|nr:hypothetical protein [Thermomonas sp.]MDI1253532.1 hypothetical protein [Thermomonas sp.]